MELVWTLWRRDNFLDSDENKILDFLTCSLVSTLILLATPCHNSSSTVMLSRQHLGTIVDTLRHDQDCTFDDCTLYVVTVFTTQWHSPGYSLS